MSSGWVKTTPPHVERSLIEGLSQRKLPLIAVDVRQSLHCIDEQRVFRSHLLLDDGYGQVIEGFGRCVLSL